MGFAAADAVARFDSAVVHAVGRARSRSPVVVKLAKMVTFFGSVPGVTMASLAGVVVVRRSPRRVAQVATAALVGIAAELLLKRVFGRARPTLLEHREIVSSTSFPSGHASAGASLCVTLALVLADSPRWRQHRTAIAVTSATAASAIAMSRVVLGVHWPSDVAAGAALGAGWAFATARLFGR